MSLFVYGTLMDGDMLAAVIGRPMAPSDRSPAVLGGFRRVGVAGRVYPMIEPWPGGRVEGFVLRRLSVADMARLAAYEGPEYRLRPVRVRVTDDGPGAVSAFAPVAGVAGDGRRWSFDVWRRRWKAGALAAFGRLAANSSVPRASQLLPRAGLG